MDQLALKFKEQQALRAVDSCDNLEELKTFTRLLIRGNCESKAFIDLLMRQQLGAPPHIAR
jgi:hypothetical protein